MFNDPCCLTCSQDDFTPSKAKLLHVEVVKHVTYSLNHDWYYVFSFCAGKCLKDTEIHICAKCIRTEDKTKERRLFPCLIKSLEWEFLY